MSGRELTLREARDLCREYRTWTVSRDSIVIRAVAAGMSKAQVHMLTGIARSTIDTILARAPAGAGTVDQAP